jgi:chromate transporter
MTAERIFLMVLLASALGFGGLASLPVLRSQLESTALPADEILLESFAVGNVGPGPNALYLVAFGYFAGGVPGWLAADVAMLIPPVLVLPIERLHNRLLHLYRFRQALASLSFAVSALLILASWSLLRSAVHDWAQLLVAVAGAVMLYRGVPPLFAVAGAALIGILVH